MEKLKECWPYSKSKMFTFYIMIKIYFTDNCKISWYNPTIKCTFETRKANLSIIMFVEEPRLPLMLIFSIYLLVTLSDAESTSNITYWTYSNLDDHQTCSGNQQSPVNIPRTGRERSDLIYFNTILLHYLWFYLVK